MSYFIDPILHPLYNQGAIPVAGPSGYDFKAARYLPAWADASGEVEWIDIHFMSATLFGIDLSKITMAIENAFINLQQGGHPIAWRLYHREFFDVSVPEQICSPDWTPFIGQECIDVPVFGGTNLITGHGWALQVFYQGSPPAIALTGSLTLILLIVIGAIALYLASSGRFTLDPGTKDLIEQFSPAGTAQSVAELFLIAAIAFGVIAYVLPNIAPTSATTIRAGPVTQTMGIQRPSPPPSSRRR